MRLFRTAPLAFWTAFVLAPAAPAAETVGYCRQPEEFGLAEEYKAEKRRPFRGE